MQIPAKLKEQLKGRPIAISDNVSPINGVLSMMGAKTLVFTDLPALYLHDSGGILSEERVCKQINLEPPNVRLQFTDQSRELSGEIAFPGGIKVNATFRQSVARIADMLVAQRVGVPGDFQFATPLPVSIRPGTAAEDAHNEADESPAEFHAVVVVAGSRLRIVAKGKTVLDLPIGRVRPTLVARRKIELKGDVILNDAQISTLTVMLPSPAMATEFLRVLHGAQTAAPNAVNGLVAPVHVKGQASGQPVDSPADAILMDTALELRAMDTGATLGCFVFSESDVHVAGSAEQFILASKECGPITVSGGAKLFREHLLRNEAVRAAAQRTLSLGAHPVFYNGDPVVCHMGSDGLAIRTTAGLRHYALAQLAALRRELEAGQEVLCVGTQTDASQEVLRFVGERSVLQSMFSALATQMFCRDFAKRPRELVGAIVALERDYFIYSLFGPLYEVHAMLAKQGAGDAMLQPLAPPAAFDKKLALANLLAQSVEPLRNHLDKLAYYFPSLLVKGDESICATQPPPAWLKHQERSYRSVLLGVQPVLVEIRMLRELLQRVRGVEERLARDADYGGAALSAALGAVINPLFLLSAAQQAFAASTSSDTQKALHSESADHAIERAVHCWNYLVFELLPGLWHHLLDALFPIRLQFYDHVRKQCVSETELAGELSARLAKRLAVLTTFLHYPGSETASKTRSDVVAGARLLQSQLVYPGLQQI